MRARPGGLLARVKAWLTRPTGRILLGFFFVSLALWALLVLGGEMAEGETKAFDRWALLALRNPANLNDPIGPRSLEEAMRDITALGGVTLLTLITIVAVVALWRSSRRAEATVFASVVLVAQVASEGLKILYDRPRPTLVPHAAYVYSNSFPSGHSAMSAAVYIMLAVVLASGLKTQASRTMVFGLAVLLVVLIGISRVYLGVHWPTDVLAGWALGCGMAFIGVIAMGRTAKA
jgi:undecaprenyl-diphosphatase